jgi:hypothetical protein
MNQPEKIPDSVRAAGKKLPFEVPDQYFDEFPGKIRDRISSDAGAGESSGRGPVRTLRPWMAAAAVFIGMLAVGYTGFRILAERSGGPYLSGDELIENMEYFSHELDEDLLITAILESDIILADETPDPESDEIIQYLSEDNIDFTGLLNNY